MLSGIINFDISNITVSVNGSPSVNPHLEKLFVSIDFFFFSICR